MLTAQLSGPLGKLEDWLARILSKMTDVIREGTHIADIHGTVGRHVPQPTADMSTPGHWEQHGKWRRFVPDVASGAEGEGGAGSSASPLGNFSRYNFGNLKAAGGGWLGFDSPEAGLRAIEDWLKRSQEQHGTDRLEEIINRYAPPSDNPGKTLVEGAVRRTGFGRNQKIDVNDPDTMRKLVEAILAQEGAPKAAFDAYAGMKPGVGAAAKGEPEGKKEYPPLENTEQQIREFETQKTVLQQQKAALEAYYDQELKGARDNKDAIVTIEQQRAAAITGIDQQILGIENQIAQKRGTATQDGAAEEIRGVTRVQEAEQAAAKQRLAAMAEATAANVRYLEKQEEGELQHAEADAKIHNQTAEQLATVQNGIVTKYQAMFGSDADCGHEGGGRRNKDLAEARQRQNDHRPNRRAKEAGELRQAKEQMQAEAKKIDYKIASDLSNVVMAAFSHQKGGVTKAVDSALQGMMSNMIQNVFKNILSASGIGQALAGNLIGKLVFGTGQAAEQATANATAMTPVLAAFLTPITALLTTMNGLLGGLVAKPSFLGNTFSLSGIVPSAADGWALPSFSGGQLSMLHANEMVLPANISQGLQGMIASGGTGGGHNITINAVDANSVAKLFCNNGGALVAALNSAMRNGSALRTSSFSNGG